MITSPDGPELGPDPALALRAAPEEVAAVPAAIRGKKRSKLQFYLVFSPQGTTPPVEVFDNHPAALGVAWLMARRHPGQSFFVMGSMSRPCIVDPDSITGCADDQTFADVPVEALRAALEAEVQS